MNFTPGRRTNATLSMQRDAGGMALTQNLSGTAGVEDGSPGWDVSVTRHSPGTDSQSAGISYLSHSAEWGARLSRYGGLTQAALSASGALVLADGDLFTARDTGDGFAVVRNAGPYARILNGGVLLGQADAGGRFLVPNLRPQVPTSLFLDPRTLPGDWLPARTRETIVTGWHRGTVADFGARQVLDMTLILQDRQHRLLAPGYRVSVNGQDVSLTGYDGEVYIPQVSQRNVVTVDMAQDGHCSVFWEMPAVPPPNRRVGPLLCL